MAFVNGTNAVATGPLTSALRVEGLSKTFGPARVLRDAALTVERGEIHGLIGANGSGKSTLVKCLTGVYVPDDSPDRVLEVDGRAIPSAYSPNAAAAMGIRVVHQEAPLIDSLELMEMVAFYRGFPTRLRSLIRRRELAETTRQIFERLDIDLSPYTIAGRLSAAERAMVMLALALADVERGARLLVLDEPTASLPAADAERFLEAVKLAAQHDVGVLMVTHRLGEVLSLTSRVTVLRDGEVVHAGPTSECTEAGLIAEIVGPTAEARSVDVHRIHVSERFVPEQKAASGSGDALLEVTDLCGDIVDGVSLSVRPGELLGISGIVGSGVSELGRLIAGVSRPASGSVRVDGRELPAGFGPRQALKAGIAYVPGDRLNEGGVMSLTVRENLLLPNLRRYWMKRSLESSDFDEVVKALDVRPPDAARVFGTLSGGNQQKVIIGKWALLRPHVFVLDDPTAGVDPGAREEIYAVLRGLEQAGTGIVFISSEPEQLARLANRVLVVKEGRIVEQLEGDDVTEHAIGTRSL